MMHLYAAGFNAWNQLLFERPKTTPLSEQPDDLPVFTRVASGNALGAITSDLTYTTVEGDGNCIAAGAIPNHHVALRERHGSFSLAANGSVVVPIDSNTIRQYTSSTTAMSSIPVKTHTFPSPILQIVSYDVGFAVLTATGEVWTWGDDRYPSCLGRDVSSTSPADEPNRVTDLEDLPTGKVVKIAGGGYTLAALTSGHDLYCWGGHPGRKAVIDGVSPGSDPVPVIVAEDRDVIDVAVGEAHAIALTDRGEVFVVGDNGNGQLGLGASECSSLQSWTKVDHNLEGQVVMEVAAGPRCAFIKTVTK